MNTKNSLTRLLWMVALLLDILTLTLYAYAIFWLLQR